MITGAQKRQGDGECKFCHKDGTDYEITHWFIKKEDVCAKCFNYIEKLRLYSGTGTISAHFGL